MTEPKNPCTEIQLPKRTKVRILTLRQLSQLTTEAWPECGVFRAARYFTWPTSGMFLYPNIAPALSLTGIANPVQLLQALVAKGALIAGSYAVLVQAADLEGEPT